MLITITYIQYRVHIKKQSGNEIFKNSIHNNRVYTTL